MHDDYVYKELGSTGLSSFANILNLLAKVALKKAKNYSFLYDK